MYRPATIKTQSLHKGTKVFYPSSSLEKRNHSRKLPAISGVSANTAPANKTFQSSSNRSENVWRTRSTGSTGSSPGASTSPSISTPLSRDSSVGSASNEDQSTGHIIARQGDIIARNSLPPMKSSAAFPNKSKGSQDTSNSWSNNSSQSRSSKNSSSKPFNHKEVIDYMNQAFTEAKKAIEAGRGKYYDPKESGAPIVAFTPFNWEEFWKQRKMNEL